MDRGSLATNDPEKSNCCLSLLPDKTSEKSKDVFLRLCSLAFPKRILTHPPFVQTGPEEAVLLEPPHCPRRLETAIKFSRVVRFHADFTVSPDSIFFIRIRFSLGIFTIEHIFRHVRFLIYLWNLSSYIEFII